MTDRDEGEWGTRCRRVRFIPVPGSVCRFTSRELQFARPLPTSWTPNRSRPNRHEQTGTGISPDSRGVKPAIGASRWRRPLDLCTISRRDASWERERLQSLPGNHHVFSKPMRTGRVDLRLSDTVGDLGCDVDEGLTEPLVPIWGRAEESSAPTWPIHLQSPATTGCRAVYRIASLGRRYVFARGVAAKPADQVSETGSTSMITDLTRALSRPSALMWSSSCCKWSGCWLRSSRS